MKEPEYHVAKCNLGKVNLRSVRPGVFPTIMHAGWPQGFALPCADESALFAICYCFAIIAVFLHCLANLLPWPTLVGSQTYISTVLGKHFC